MVFITSKHLRFELALRLIDPDVSLPYWDSTLDGAIPNSTDTSLFTDSLMGRTDENGYVISGFDANWRSQNVSIRLSLSILTCPTYAKSFLTCPTYAKLLLTCPTYANL